MMHKGWLRPALPAALLNHLHFNGNPGRRLSFIGRNRLLGGRGSDKVHKEEIVMARFFDACSWLLSSLGLALLVASLMLSPSQGVFADSGHANPAIVAQCPEQFPSTACNDKCVSVVIVQPGKPNENKCTDGTDQNGPPTCKTTDRCKACSCNLDVTIITFPDGHTETTVVCACAT